MHQTDELDIPQRETGSLPSVTGTGLILAAAGGVFLLSQGFAQSEIQIVLIAIAIGLAAVGVLALVAHILRRQRSGRSVTAFRHLTELAGDAHALTSLSGTLIATNPAFRRLPSVAMLDSLSECLSELVEQSASEIYMVARGAMSEGAARRVVRDADGQRYGLSASRVAENLLHWRVEPELEPAPKPEVSIAQEPFGQVRLMTDGRVKTANNFLTSRCGPELEQMADILIDAPLRPGGIHRLNSDCERKVRAFAIDSGGEARDVYLFPVDREEVGETQDGFLDALPVALLRISPAGKVLFSNAAARSLMGIEIANGMPLVGLIEGLGRSVPDWLAEVARGRSGKHSEVVRNRSAEHDKFMQIALSRLVSDGDVSVIAVLSDATEMKSLEAQFVQSQKMQAVGQLAGGVAHDFNNLLTAINGHCDLLLLRHEAGDTDHGDLVQIRQNANRAASLVRQLLAFSRKQTLRPKVLKLSETLGELTHLLNRLLGARVTLSIEYGPDLMSVRVDERQFEQVIMNLVVNARDAMAGVGDVRIATRNVSFTSQQRRGRVVMPSGDYVLVEVGDSGVGIPDDVVEKIFEPFFTTKKQGEGTGLGLSTVYGIIKQTAGFIFAESVPGQGTTFSIYLPAYQPDAEDQTASVQENKISDLTGHGTILLVEDEEPVRSFAARALQLRGYTVHEADCGEQALEVLATIKEPLDLLISDVVMPGMDGPTWVREARKSLHDVSVIFVSGYAEDVFGADEDALKNASFVPKPFSLNELTQKVKEVLDERERTPEPA